MAKKTGRPVWFRFFLNQKSLIDAVPDAIAGKALKVALKYFDTREVDIVNLDPLVLAVFSSMREYIDESFADYERSQENGKKGGRPKKRSSEEENPPLPTLTHTDTEAETEAETETKADVEAERKKTPFGEYANVYLTEAEYNALSHRFGKGVANGLIDSFSRKLKAKGYHYENHYGTIIDWANKDGVRKKSDNSYELDEFFNSACARAREEFGKE